MQLTVSVGGLKRQFGDQEQVRICYRKFVSRWKPSKKNASPVLHDYRHQRAKTQHDVMNWPVSYRNRADREISEKKPAVFLFIFSPPFHYSVISLATVVLPRTARIRIKKHHRRPVVDDMHEQWRIYPMCMDTELFGIVI